jgi:Na+/H+ antiporter NhaD/arsenite permease-like protein
MKNPLLLVLYVCCGAVMLAAAWLAINGLFHGKKISLDFSMNRQKPALTPRAIWLRFVPKAALFTYMLLLGALQVHSPVLVAVSVLALVSSTIVLAISLKKLQSTNSNPNSENAI